MTWNDLERSVLGALHWSNLSTVLSNHSCDLISLVSVKVHDWSESTDRKLWHHHNQSHTQLLYRLHCLTKPIAMDSPSNFEITSEHSESEHSEIQVTPVATPVKESTGKNKRRSVGAGTLSLLKKKHVWSFLKTRHAVKVHIYCVYAYL